jgi:peroxiredoxin
MRGRIVGALAAVAIAAAVIVGFGYLRGERATHLRPGQDAPDVELASVEGAPGRLRDNLGTATLVVFVHTRWEEMPRYAVVLERVYRKYQRRGFRVIGICLDDSVADARAFIQAHAVTFTVFHDPGGRATSASGWGMPSGPESYLLDRAGKVVATFPDPVNWANDDRYAKLEALLPSPAPGSW